MNIKKLFITGCTPCMAVTEVLKDKAFDGLEIDSIDMSSPEIQKQMIEEYKLVNVPTLIFYKEGKEVWRLDWFISKEQIEKFIK